MITASSFQHERRLLREIGALATRARDLRRTDAVRHDAEIKLLTGDLQAKWSEIRALRAGLMNGAAVVDAVANAETRAARVGMRA